MAVVTVLTIRGNTIYVRVKVSTMQGIRGGFRHFTVTCPIDRGILYKTITLNFVDKRVVDVFGAVLVH